MAARTVYIVALFEWTADGFESIVRMEGAYLDRLAAESALERYAADLERRDGYDPQREAYRIIPLPLTWPASCPWRTD